MRHELPPVLERWQCDSCGDLHEDKDEAVECCRPVVLHVYCCPVCREDFTRESLAIACRDQHSTAEIEDAGIDAEPLPYAIPTGIVDPTAYVAAFCHMNWLTQ